MSDIIEEAGQAVVLKKAQNPVTDSMGVETEKVYTDVNITAVIQPINSKELERDTSGRLNAGMKKAYCKPSYTQGGIDYTVEPGDKIIDWNDVPWRVESIEHDHGLGETEIYRKAILRRLQ